VETDEHESISGFPVTNVLRTVLDIWREGTLPKPILRRAFTEALRQAKPDETARRTGKEEPSYGVDSGSALDGVGINA